MAVFPHSVSLRSQDINISSESLILSPCEYLNDRTNDIPDHSVQGYGKPNRVRVIYSQNWHACYLLEGEIEIKDANKYHRYRLLFPDKADEIDVTLVYGKLHTMFGGKKSDYIHIKFARPGVKFGTPLKPQIILGESKCFCTYKAQNTIRRGSKGVWNIDVIFQLP